MALPTNGRVIIDTTAGEIDIELWSKETPKTCRNFLALAMEGYYDGVIFHRIVPGFLVQTGDKTGTGGGGESFYGEPFEDEIHPRLRFPHRGLVAMANNGTKNSNDSQFFITLDRADELHGKHTLFGRCVGDTVYNVIKIGEMEIDKNERPVYPPKIKGIRIIDNPFPDIIPRITAAERRTQQRAREQAQKEREEYERRKGAKKNVTLLSFGADEGGEGEEVSFKKKPIYRPDLVVNDSHSGPSTTLPDFVTKSALSSLPKDKDTGKQKEHETDSSKPEKPKKKNDDKEMDILKIREKHAEEKASSSSARKTEIEKIEADIRKLTKRRDGEEDSDDERKKKKPKTSYLEAELSKYTKGRGLKGKKGKRKDEGDILEALNAFRGKLQSSLPEDEPEDVVTDDKEGDAPAPTTTMTTTEDPGMEVDDDRGFLGHSLHFPKDDGEETRKAERDYEVIDPRQRGARAKEEERERKAKIKLRDGGRGARGSYRGGGGSSGNHRR